MDKTPSNLNDWAPCPEGELVEAVGRLKARRRDNLAARAVGLGGLLAIVLFVGLIAYQQYQKMSNYDYGGISCSQVYSHLEGYAAGELSQELSEKIRIHLAKCPKCQQAYERLLNTEQLARSADGHDAHEWNCDCAKCRPQVAFAE